LSQFPNKEPSNMDMSTSIYLLLHILKLYKIIYIYIE